MDLAGVVACRVCLHGVHVSRRFTGKASLFRLPFRLSLSICCLNEILRRWERVAAFAAVEIPFGPDIGLLSADADGDSVTSVTQVRSGL